MKILKSGGESTGTPEKIKLLTSYIKNIPETIVLVVSAPAGKKRVTELLKDMFNGKDKKEDINQVYVELAQGLGINFDTDIIWRNIEDAKRVDDYLYRGEYAQATLISNYLRKEGVNAVFVDAKEAILTDSNFGDGKILGIKDELFRNHQVYVVGGYHGANEIGETVVLPIGGSDITAGALAGYLKANEYQNLKEIPGVAVVDPKYIRDSIIMRNATFAEIREAVYRSRKSLLEPISLKWCKRENIPIRIKSLQHPDKEGTLITNGRDLTNQPPLTNIACKEGFIIYDCLKKQNSAFFTKSFEIFQSYNISIDMINTMDNVVSIAVHKSELKERDDVEKQLREISQSLKIYDDQALVSIVGEGIVKPLTFKKWLMDNLENQPLAIYGPILGGLRTDLTTFYIELFGMNSIVGYTKNLTNFFEKNNLSIIATSTCIDAFSIGVNEKLSKKEILEICDKLKKEVGADTICVTENGLHCYGPEKDVRNLTLAVPEKIANGTVTEIYTKLVAKGYFF